MTWLSEEPKSLKLDNSTLLELLESYNTRELKALELFGQHKNILTAAMVALLAAGGASLATQIDVLQFASFLIPTFVVRLRRHAINTLDRYYRRFLEAIVCKSKIEFMLGLNQAVCPKDRSLTIDNSEILFSADTYLGVARHWENSVGIRSNEWVFKYMSKGHNSVVWQLFRDICFATAVLPILGVALIGKWLRPDCIFMVFKDNWVICVCGAGAVVAAIWLYCFDSSRIEQDRKKEAGLPDDCVSTHTEA